MHAPSNELPVLFGLGTAVIRASDWGDLRAAFVTLPAGTDVTPLLKGLPGDRCQCPHWGYIVKGTMRMIHDGREETFAAGDLYYMPPGHTVIALEDVEYVEFSPPRSFDESLAAIQRNVSQGS
jgi:hypothetical protein